MSNEKVFAKMEKFAAKKKSNKVIDLMKKADNETLIKALESLAQIADEDSCNMITHFLDNPADEIRVAACKAALAINTEYMKTRVRYQLQTEQNAEVKKEIQEAFNKANA